jgi:hypothetical protein
MLWRLVQQSNSERELILQQRQFLSENTSTLEMLHKNLKRIVSDGNLDTAEALVAALEQLMGKIDELDLAKDEGRESDTGPGL